MACHAGQHFAVTETMAALRIDNNAAERSIRGIALCRKNYLFAGSNTGGNRAAAVYSLTLTCKFNAIDREAVDCHLDLTQ